MTYEPSVAPYALNSYTWKVLQANLGWSISDYQGRVPIIPTAQQPELLQSKKAFVVYGSANHPPTHLYQLNTEAIAYNIFAPTTTEANKIAQLLFDVFKRQDDAATDVNDWLDTENKGRGISFTSIMSNMVEKAEPADEEGGYVSALLLITMQYTAQPTGLITSGFTID